MTSDEYASVILSIAETPERYFRRIIKSLNSVSEDELTTMTEDGIIERLGNFPRGSDEFSLMIKRIVMIGRRNITESISVLMRLFPLATEHDLFLRFVKNLRGASEHNSLSKGFLRVCCGFIFADAVSGILSYATERVDLYLVDLVLELMKSLEEVDQLFGYYWRRVKKQCSVIVGLLSKYAFDDVNEAFSDFLETITANNAKDIVLFRFVRFNPSCIRAIMSQVVNVVRHNRHTPEMMKALLSFIRYILMQDVEGATISMVTAANQYASKHAEYRDIVTEISALILSKQKDITMKNIAEFFESIALEEGNIRKGKRGPLKVKVKMRSLLYVLSGNGFNERWFWRNGLMCGLEFHDSEFISCEGADVVGLYNILLEHWASDGGNSNFYVTQILMNLVYRNYAQTVGLLLRALSNVEGEQLIPLLDVLWRMLSGNEIEVDAHCKSSILAAVIRLSERYRVKEPMKMATCPQFLSRNQEPMDIDPTCVPVPSDFLDHLMELTGEDEAKVAKKLKGSQWQVLGLKYTSSFNQNRRDDEKIIVLLICLLSRLQITPDSVQCLLDFGLCSKTSIVQFALLACQIIYLKNESSRQILWEEMFKIVRGQTNEAELLTLLIQMYHMMSLGVNVTDSWCDNMQISILLHLSSPYVCIRRVLLLMIERMEEVVEARETVFKAYNSSKEAVANQIKARFPELGAVYFEDACGCANIDLYAVALSEFLASILRSKYTNVLSYFRSCDRLSLNTDQSVETAHSFILTSCLLFRMAGVLESGYQLFKQDSQFLSGESYVERYKIDDPFVNDGFLDDAASELFAKLLDNYLESGNPLVNHITRNLSPFYLAEFCKAMAARMNEPLEEGRKFGRMTRLSEAMKEATKSNDLQLTFYCYPSSFKDLKFILLGFTAEIKKCGSNLPPSACVLINNIFSIVKQLCNGIPYLFSPGIEGSLRQYRVPGFMKGNEWPASEKYMLLLLIKRLGHEMSVGVNDTLSAIVRAGPVFRSESDVNLNEPYIDENLSMILQYHPFLLDTYARKAYGGQAKFFRCICEMFYGTPNSNPEISLEDVALNSDCLAKYGVLLTLLFVYSFSERKIALRAIRRLVCVFDGLLHPDDLKAISKFNLLAEENPAPEKVIMATLETLPGLATEVFAEAVLRLKQGVSHGLDITLLNVLCIVAGYIELSSRSAGFIVHLLDAYFLIPSHLHKPYTQVFVGFCENSEANKQYLAHCLCQLSAKEKRKEVVVRAVTLLSRKYPEIFLARAVQSLSFGYWFYTNSYCSDFIQKGQEHIIYDDRQCCAEIVWCLSRKYRTLLEPFIATIVHFCVLFHEEFPIAAKIIKNLFGIDSITDRETLLLKYKESYPDPKHIRDWVDIALKWFTSCGSLEIAAKSGEILMDLHEYSPEVIQRIIWSLNSVLNVKYKRKYKSVSRYIKCSLQLLASVVRHLASPTKKLITNLFDYLKGLRNQLDKDLQSGIIDVYRALWSRQHVEGSDEILLYVAGLLTPDTKSGLISGLRFLSEWIQQASEVWQREVLLCVIYPALFECVGVQATPGVKEVVRMCCSALKQTAFGGSIPLLFESKQDLLEWNTMQDLAKEMSLNHAYEVEKSGKYLDVMCLNKVQSAFRFLELMFVEADKEWFYDVFAQSIWSAVQCHDLSFLERIEFNGNVRLKEPPITSHSGPSAVIKAFIPPKTYETGDVNVDLPKVYIPMIPLFHNAWKDCHAAVSAVRAMVPQPFIGQDQALKKIKATRRASTAVKPCTPDVEALLRHSRAKEFGIEDEGSTEHVPDKISPDFFTPEPPEFGGFCARIDKL